jgi:hypothetical protein
MFAILWTTIAYSPLAVSPLDEVFGGCDVPCWYGVHPGMTREEVDATLKQFDVIQRTGDYYELRRESSVSLPRQTTLIYFDAGYQVQSIHVSVYLCLWDGMMAFGYPIGIDGGTILMRRGVTLDYNQIQERFTLIQLSDNIHEPIPFERKELDHWLDCES